MNIKRIKSILKENEYVFIILFGFILIFYVYYKYAIGTKGQDWPKTDGIVVASEVITQLIQTKDGNKIKEHPKIVYEYIVDEEKYIGNKFGLVKGIAKIIVKNYPIGSKVIVYYNPENPIESVLNPGFQFGYNILIVSFGLFMIILGSYLMYLKIYKLKNINVWKR